MKRRRKRIQSAKHAQRKKRIFKFRVALTITLVVAILVGLSFWTRHDSFTVQTVEITSTNHLDEELMKSLAEEEIEGAHLFIFDRSNRLFIPRQKIKERIYTEMPAVKHLSIRAHKDVLTLTADEFSAVALWCSSSFIPTDVVLEETVEGLEESVDEVDDEVEAVPEVVGNGGCYFMNENGLVFSEEPELHTYTLPTYKNSIEVGPIGETYVSQKFFKTLQKFRKTLMDELSITIVEVSTEDGVTYNFQTEEGPVLSVDSTDNFVTVADNLATLIEKDAINAAQFGNIEYIDLRFGNRVYYKLK